jgi:hypothetical protein
MFSLISLCCRDELDEVCRGIDVGVDVANIV